MRRIDFYLLCLLCILSFLSFLTDRFSLRLNLSHPLFRALHWTISFCLLFVLFTWPSSLFLSVDISALDEVIGPVLEHSDGPVREQSHRDPPLPEICVLL